MTFKDATDLLAVPLADVAAAIGRSYATTLAYRSGAREVPSEVRRRLGLLMRRHAERLAAAAGELDRRA